jgi:hypothetical protein
MPGFLARMSFLTARPSDVIQETHVVALHRLDDYLSRRPMPFHL